MTRHSGQAGDFSASFGSGPGQDDNGDATTVPVKSDEDIVILRKLVRERAIAIRLNLP